MLKVTALKERCACSKLMTDPPAFADNGKYDRPRAAFHLSTMFLEPSLQEVQHRIASGHRTNDQFSKARASSTEHSVPIV
jgi:hypothetical protein